MAEYSAADIEDFVFHLFAVLGVAVPIIMGFIYGFIQLNEDVKRGRSFLMTIFASLCKAALVWFLTLILTFFAYGITSSFTSSGGENSGLGIVIVVMVGGLAGIPGAILFLIASILVTWIKKSKMNRV